MMQTEIDKFKERFEPNTCDGSSLVSLEGAALASLAISIKRIADMLDGTAIGINCAETIFNPSR
jgi:hypothetical protein